MTTQPKAKRTGVLTCGICGKALKQAQWFAGFVCPDARCINSEERYYE